MKKIIITIIVILLTTNALSETNTLQTMLINGQLGVDTPCCCYQKQDNKKCNPGLQ